MPMIRLVMLAVLLQCSALVQAETPFDGEWRGAIETPGRALEIEIEFESAEDGALTGTISIPVQSLNDVELTGVANTTTTETATTEPSVTETSTANTALEHLE